MELNMDGPSLACLLVVIFSSLAVLWSAYRLGVNRKRAHKRTLQGAHRLMVRADWDADAGVWVASSGDVPGLATEAATVEALATKLTNLVPLLLEANGRAADVAKPIELIARRFPVVFVGD
jgi:predicted RNase H-like HicB family nuclease